MSYVDLMSDVRWSEADHVSRVEAHLRSSVSHVREHVMLRRSIGFTFYLFAQMLPAGPTKDLLTPFGQPLTPAALAELTAAAQAFLQADALAAEARADSARLDQALDYEAARSALTALADKPYPPRTDYPKGTAGDKPYADACAAVDAANALTAAGRAAQRVAPQAVVSAATADTLNLVGLRDAARAPPPTTTQGATA